jgi:hypothetical protein
MGLVETLFGKPGRPQPEAEEYIANVANNRQLFRKAYMIEFMNGGELEDAFTFSFPPESEELTHTQRKSETKTFGGLHIDDYGNDAVKIVLSGSTINQALRVIYRGAKDPKWLSGEEEIYYLRDLLLKYKSIDKLSGPNNKERKIIIYDLSKTKIVNTNIKNYWQAFPGDFKIRRASDRPFAFKYTFEFTGIPLEEGIEPNSHAWPPQLTPAKAGLIQTILEGVVAAIDFIDGINGRVNNILDKVNQVSSLLKILGNVMSYSANTLSGIIDSVGDTAAGLIDGATSVVNGVNSVVSLPRTIQLKALSVGLDLQNATKELTIATSALAQNVRDVFTEEHYQIPQEVLDQYEMNNEEFKDAINNMLYEAENTASEMAAAAKSSVIPDVTVGNPDKETGEQTLCLSYGHKNVMLTDTDTLESLAKQYLGDSDRAVDIASYNGIASLSDMKPGDTIMLPIPNQSQKMKGNLIYTKHGERDNYGRDILLTDDGSIVASATGDFALTEGPMNLSQAVLLRLRERVAKRIRLNAYGIRTNISDPTAGIAYIISSINLTVSSDPRVASVDKINFKAYGDRLNVNVDYSDIDSAGGNVAGGL